MKKFLKRSSLLALFAVLSPSLASCASEDVLVLRCLNCEDYIGESEFEYTYENALGEEVTVTYDDVLSGFEKYESERLGRKVRVVYDTYDTNETMLASLKTGKTSYDLIAASDYTVQKMMSLGMLQRIDPIPNYEAYCSTYLHGVMDSITAPVPGLIDPQKMSDYSVGYMWGTLGILFNPAKVSKDKNIPESEVLFDMQSWDSLWNEKYKNEMSVKDSMRDTYSVGIMKQYEAEILANMAKSGAFDMEDTMLSLLETDFEDGQFLSEAVRTYNAELTEIFNRCDEKTVSEVKNVLLSLKENVFGFEVDSGKDDMVKGLVGMNLAWSGDAVYSMDKGENEENTTIYYSIPRTGGNIWFDSWCMPKECQGLNRVMAQDFLNFISDPIVAAANMETIGYTSFIAGDTVHSLIRLWFDPRAYAMYQYHDASSDPDCTWEDSDFIYRSYVLTPEGEEVPVQDGYDYDEDSDIRFQRGFDLTADDVADFDFEEGILNMAGSTFAAPCVDGVEVSWEEYPALYNEKAAQINDLIAQHNLYFPWSPIEEIELFDEEEDGTVPLPWDVRDLTYMFEGTLTEDGSENAAEPLYHEDPTLNPYLFYTDELEEGEFMGETVTVGRQFYAQYPDTAMIPKLAVMRDYGENNIYVLKMWNDVKSNNLPLAGVIVFAIILGSAAILIVGYALTKKHYHKFRVARRKAIAAEAKAKKTGKDE